MHAFKHDNNTPFAIINTRQVPSPINMDQKNKTFTKHYAKKTKHCNKTFIKHALILQNLVYFLKQLQFHWYLSKD